MSNTEILKTYGETALKVYKTQLLVTIGAGDLVVERARGVVEQLRARAEALPHQAQVQADPAAREARPRATEAAGRGRTVVQAARTTAAAFGERAKPETVRTTVTDLLETARSQAAPILGTLVVRGAGVVDELRRELAFHDVVPGAERVDDAVVITLEDVEVVSETVAEESGEVTSVAQKTAVTAAAKADPAADDPTA
jgi:heparin binding hemagglutinin HbhA